MRYDGRTVVDGCAFITINSDQINKPGDNNLPVLEAAHVLQ